MIVNETYHNMYYCCCHNILMCVLFHSQLLFSCIQYCTGIWWSAFLCGMVHHISLLYYTVQYWEYYISFFYPLQLVRSGERVALVHGRGLQCIGKRVFSSKRHNNPEETPAASTEASEVKEVSVGECQIKSVVTWTPVVYSRCIPGALNSSLWRQCSRDSKNF